MDLESIKDAILDEFPIDLESTRALTFREEDSYLESNIFQVNEKKSFLLEDSHSLGSIYIIDSQPGRMIACHPSIVGEDLEGLCLKASTSFSHALENIGLFKPKGTVVLHILRGAAGYRVVDSLRVRVPVLSIRTEYQGDAYRAHSDDSRSLSVTYKNYPVDLELGSISNVIIPDTYATGRSAEAALHELFAAGLEPSQIILYGFIAIPALERIGNICKEKGIKMDSFAICNLTQLASNNYDMPIYGLDESLYFSRRRIRKMGSIISKKTFLSILTKYIAGMDQPGDWSERQVSLFNGQGNEAGNIKGHLIKSLKLIESLKSLNSNQKWYNDFHEEISKQEIASIKKALIDYNK